MLTASLAKGRIKEDIQVVRRLWLVGSLQDVRLWREVTLKHLEAICITALAEQANVGVFLVHRVRHVDTSFHRDHRVLGRVKPVVAPVSQTTLGLVSVLLELG